MKYVIRRSTLGALDFIATSIVVKIGWDGTHSKLFILSIAIWSKWKSALVEKWKVPASYFHLDATSNATDVTCCARAVSLSIINNCRRSEWKSLYVRKINGQKLPAVSFKFSRSFLLLDATSNAIDMNCYARAVSLSIINICNLKRMKISLC
jgi:hypothetical protein